jgi:hypothetical protein
MVERRLKRAGVLALAGSLAACASLDGLTGGSDGGTGPCRTCVDASRGDATVAHDAAPPTDASDAMEAFVDAAVDVAEDRGTPADANHDAAVACMPVVTPEAGLPSTCAALGDAGTGTCAPSAILPTQLQWIPPNAPQSACTSAEIANISTGGTISQACSECLYSYVGMSSYGPIIQFPQVVFDVWTQTNFGGCIALVDPCNLACAKALFAATLCTTTSCLPKCPGDTEESYDELSTCASSEALDCPCTELAASAESCIKALFAENSPATKCLPELGTTASEEEQAAAQLVAVTTELCGGGL